MDKVKIRGIYSTALTRWLMEEGYSMVEPSLEIRQRMSLPEALPPEDILIRDRQDRQGIVISGSPEKLTPLVSRIQHRFEDAVLLALEPAEEPEGNLMATMEFPGRTKQVMDSIRSMVVPTVFRHHLLRIVNSMRLDDAESLLRERPEMKAQVEESLFRELVMAPLERRGIAQFHHVTISGRPVRPRKGVICEIWDRGFALKRSLRFPGIYDGLQVSIEEGDIALTHIREGYWTIKHEYFSSKGEPKGQYFNINTPVEIYPWGARYVDLEVDVVRRPGQTPQIIDKEKLAILRHEGFIHESLVKRAISVAEQIVRLLEGGMDPMSPNHEKEQ